MARDDAWPAGREAYSSECAACHPAAAVVAGAFASPADWRPLADLLLTGEARLPDRGEGRLVKRHPTFEAASDERLAAILNYLLVSSPVDRDAKATQVTSTDLRAMRSRRHELQTPK
jgi:mono/diheme cytochrome c family protein